MTEDQSMGGVYRYTDSVVAVLDATNMLIMLEALVSKCKFMLKTNLKLACMASCWPGSRRMSSL